MIEQNIYTIIVAAGSGNRMNNSTPKQFLLLNDKPIIVHSIEKFLKCFPNGKIIVVLSDFSYADEFIKPYLSHANIEYVKGGQTRFQSVRNGLNAVPNTDNIFVAVHDAVRCLATEEMIIEGFKTANEKGNAIPIIDAVDSLRLLNNNKWNAIDRTKVKIVQTPQWCRADILKKAFAHNEQPQFTDEASVLEFDNTELFFYNGEDTNIKITTPKDLLLAEYFLKTMK